MNPALAPPVASLVPHAGPMCLLERVLDWDADRIRCAATIADAHPLRDGERLPATALIEYAAQAMAAHGRLLALADAGANEAAGAAVGTPAPGPKPGRLVGLRATELACRWVDHRRLMIDVRRLGGDAAGILYDFTVVGSDAGSDAVTLATGRAFVALEPGR